MCSKILQNNINKKNFKWFNDSYLIKQSNNEYENIKLCYYYGFVLNIINGNNININKNKYTKYFYLYREIYDNIIKYICYEPINDYKPLFMIKPFIFNLFNNSVKNIHNEIKLYFNSNQIMTTIYKIDLNKDKLTIFDYPNELQYFLLILLKKIQQKFNI